MNLLRTIESFPERFRGGALSVGNFDGVHQGHARLIERLVAQARRVGGPAVVFTFDPHPVRILRPDRAPVPLCWTQRNAELLGQLGVDAVLAYPTDEAFLRLDARAFFDRIVREVLDAQAMVEGPNFFFGRNRSGNIEVLGRFCREAGMPLDVVEAVETDGVLVSSSRIREAITEGRVKDAGQMLCKPYRIRGTVVEGRRRGRTLGFPTANVDWIETLLPGEGIYAGIGLVDGQRWPAAISVGANPTFDEHQRKIEAFLLDFEGDLYGRSIEVDFLERLRDIERFASADALVAQMTLDVDTTRRIAAEYLGDADARTAKEEGRGETGKKGS